MGTGGNGTVKSDSQSPVVDISIYPSALRGYAVGNMCKFI